jgi:ATP-binding cassette, subfamily C, bacterial
VYAVAMRGTRLRNVFSPVMVAAEYVATIAVLAVGTRLVGTSSVSVGTVTAAALYQVRLAEPIYVLIEYLDEIQKAGAALSRLVGLRNAATESGRRVVSELRPQGGDVAVGGLSFGYLPDRPVLREVTVHVGDGERVALVGPSGAGKSTLAALIAGIHRPNHGQISIGGADVASLTATDLRRVVCLVSQEAHVFGPTIAADLRLPRPDATDSEIAAALDAVGASAWVGELAGGADTAVGIDGIRLDPAQTQQLALARVIVADPRVVVLDEATAAFDLGTARRIERAVNAALAGRTVIAVTHRLGEAERFDRIVMIDHGRIVADGSPQQLLDTDGPYRVMRQAAV